MELSWLNTLIYGFVTGITDILPVGSRVHSQLLRTVWGAQENNLCLFLIHIGILLGLYQSCSAAVSKILRALALARIPKRKRTRPLDMKGLLEFRYLRSTALMVVLLYIFYAPIRKLESHQVVLALFAFLNGFLLYLPQFFPGGNKNNLNMTKLDGVVVGLGQGLSVFPGISGIGAGISFGSVCLVEKRYALQMALMTEMTVMVCQLVNDLIVMLALGAGTITVGMVLKCLACGLTAFGGTLLGVRFMRKIFVEVGMQVFAFYCWGLAFLVFFLNLMA